MTDKTNGEEDIALVQFEETVCHGGVGMAAGIIREGLEATGGAWENHLLGKALMDSESEGEHRSQRGQGASLDPGLLSAHLQNIPCSPNWVYSGIPLGWRAGMIYGILVRMGQDASGPKRKEPGLAP